MKRFLLVLSAFPLFAHDLYLMPYHFVVQPGKKVQIAFHNGDDFPDSQVAARVDRMLEPRILSSETSAPLENLRPEGKIVLGEALVPGSGNLLVAVRSKPNGIELAPSNFEKYLRHEGLDHVIQWRAEHSESSQVGRERYSKYVKSILLAGEPTDYYRHVVGFPIEILPEANPYLLKAGDSLPIQVLFRNKPAADLQIEMAWLPPEAKSQIRIAGRTDKDGRLLIPIGSKGTWKLHTVLMERCSEPAIADWESFWASLTFEIR